MFSVDWVQHPIGHGGFHSARMRHGSDLNLNWVFDCGSRRTTRFDAYLRAWTDQRQEPIDWLFISHFDTDHVSGIDTLMARSVIRDVMVPYVNERDLAYLALYEISRDNLDWTFFELVADPAAFFLSRGAERVTFLGGPPGQYFEDGGPWPGPEKDGHGWMMKIRPLPRPIQRLYSTRSTPRGSAYVINRPMCEINISRGGEGLLLKPYRAPIQRRSHRGLIQELQTIVGPANRRPGPHGMGDLAYAIAHHARTSRGRAELRLVFKARVGSSNRGSLSLLSTPMVSNYSTARWHVIRPFGRSQDLGKTAWLNTGDAELIEAADLQDWRRAYASEIPSVRVLALPHHGSDRNSDARFQHLCPDATLVAHVKSSAKKHPGVGVGLAAGSRLACVTEQPGSQVTMHFRST